MPIRSKRRDPKGMSGHREKDTTKPIEGIGNGQEFGRREEQTKEEKQRRGKQGLEAGGQAAEMTERL